jgi:formylmethanofuran dehydrogenase subunit E
MNQGYLRMLVIQQLQEKPRSGYAIVKTIHEQTGWKPSYGSMYPLLEKLETEGAVTAREEGRSKIYSLTAAGRERFVNLQERRKVAFTGIHEQLKLLASMGDEEAAQAADMMQQQMSAAVPFKEFPELVAMKTELHRLLTEGKFETKKKDIRAIAHTAHLALKKL